MSPQMPETHILSIDALFLGCTESASAISEWFYDRGTFLKQCICKRESEIVSTVAFAGPQRMTNLIADLRTRHN